MEGFGRRKKVIRTRQKQIRSFVAIPVPLDGIQALEEAVRQFDSEIGQDVRWVRPEGIHLTLKFMGNISVDMLDRVLMALPAVTARFSPLKLEIAGLGAFPNLCNPRVLLTGVEGDLEGLSKLQSAVDDTVVDLGLPEEKRSFSPHLTLGRVRRGVPDGRLQKIAEVFAKRESLAFPAWTADTVNLLRTELDPAGSRHYLVGTAKIGGG